MDRLQVLRVERLRDIDQPRFQLEPAAGGQPVLAVFQLEVVALIELVA